jgi:hypothetical protein
MGLQKTFFSGGHQLVGISPSLWAISIEKLKMNHWIQGDTIFRQTKMVLFKNPGTG